VIDPRLVLCLASALISILVALRFLAARRMWSHALPQTGSSGWKARLTVIIPARDEEQGIALGLQSVLDQREVDLEVIVVNDHSSDRTGAICDAVAVAEPRLRVIHNPELPAGWLGKCNAMQHAADMASGDVLLFTDADVVHAPQCFVTGMAEMERRALDFLSLFPRIECVSLWENAILPALVGGLAVLATPFVEDRRSPDALASGAFLMIRAHVFRAIGGFRSITHEMVDDVALARLVKRNGHRVGFRLAPQLLSVHLFKGNRHAFWGMTKNILEGLRGRIWIAPLAILLPVLVFWMPVYCAAAGVWEARPSLLLLGLGAYGIQYAIIWMSRPIFRYRSFKALLFPLVAVPVACCMGRALYLYTCKGSVHWRGRTIRVGARAEG
jgi:chlorobactene glucosyltransferase